MSTMDLLARLERNAVPPELQRRLFDAIGDLFAMAIDRRTPANRPPGKAGLRAEKGYYRLLYLEGEYRQQVAPDPQRPENPPYEWHHLTAILDQLRDLPELQTQLTSDIESVADTLFAQQ